MSFIGEGKGTQSDPFRITNADELFSMGGFPFGEGGDVYYELMNDIDLNDTLIRNGFTGPWFQSNFEGNGYTISNINLVGTASGFFNSIYNGVVRNLTLDGIKIDKESGFGGLARNITGDSLIENFHIKRFTQNWRRKFTFAGGIAENVGSTSGDSRTIIRNCSVSEISLETERYGGGFVLNIRNADVIDNLVYGFMRVNPRYYSYDFANVHGSYSGKVEGNIVANTTPYSSTLISNVPTSKVIRIAPNSTNPSDYTSAPLDRPWVFGEEKPWNMVEGDLPFNTHYGTNINPVKVSTVNDLRSKVLNPNFRSDLPTTYKLMNDIDMSELVNVSTNSNNIYSPLSSDINSPAVNGKFYGRIDGDGNTITLPEYTIDSGTSAVKLGLFNNTTKTLLENLNIEWNVTDNSNSGELYLTSKESDVLELKNISLTLNGLGAKGLTTALPLEPKRGTFEDISIDYKDVNADMNPSNPWLMRQNDDTQENTLNRVILNIDTNLNTFPDSIIKKADNTIVDTNISNVIVSVNGYTQADNANANFKTMTKADVMSGSGSEFDTFRDNWRFSAPDMPKPRILVKVAVQLEKRISKSYSQIMYSDLNLNRRTKILLRNSVNFIYSFASNFLFIFRKSVNYAKKSNSNVKTIKKSTNNVLNKMSKVGFKLNRIGARIRASKSYMRDLSGSAHSIKSRISVLKSSVKSVRSFSFNNIKLIKKVKNKVSKLYLIDITNLKKLKESISHMRNVSYNTSTSKSKLVNLNNNIKVIGSKTLNRLNSTTVNTINQIRFSTNAFMSATARFIEITSHVKDISVDYKSKRVKLQLVNSFAEKFSFSALLMTIGRQTKIVRSNIRNISSSTTINKIMNRIRSVKSYTKALTVKSENYRVKLKDVTSHINKINTVSVVNLIKRYVTIVKSTIDKISITQKINRLMIRLAGVVSYIGEFTINVDTDRGRFKSVSSYTEKIASSALWTSLERFTTTATNSVKSISLKTKTITESVRTMIVSSYTAKIKTKARMRVITGMIGREVLVSSVKAIGHGMSRTAKLKKGIKNTVSKIRSFSFIYDSIPKAKEIIAHISAKFNLVKLIKKENMIKTSQSESMTKMTIKKNKSVVNNKKIRGGKNGINRRYS